MNPWNATERGATSGDGARQRSISFPSTLTILFFSSLKRIFSGFSTMQNSSTRKSSLQGAGLGYLTAFWLLKIEAVWFYSTLQLLCILGDCLTWAFPEISRAGNWVSKNWIILPKFTQLWFFPPSLFLSNILPFLLFFLHGRHFLKNVNSETRYLVLSIWLCMTLGKLLLLVCLGLWCKNEDNNIYSIWSLRG